MIVYGDQVRRTSLGECVRRLRHLIVEVYWRQSDPLSTADVLRSTLIRLGEYEQAVHDVFGDGHPYVRQAHVLTERAATLFCASYRHPAVTSSPAEWLDALDALPQNADDEVQINVPEGFAYYALYPEQYLVSAERWAADHAYVHDKRAAVVGIRSIGTTLGAVVAAVLRAHGWTAAAFTVRPTGHPYERQATIAPERLDGAAWGLVVDEGPGQSGSSMVAAADALLAAGVPREQISFFPGHGGEPGGAASPHIRRWWQTTPRYVTPLADVRFDERALPDALAHTLSQRYGDVERIDDLSAGSWRSFLFSRPIDYPPAYTRFEATTYRMTFASGTHILVQYGGLGHTLKGFVEYVWEAAPPLRRDQLNDALLRQLALAMHTDADRPSAQRQPFAQFRPTLPMRDMLYWNTWEALGEPAAEQARAIIERLSAIPDDWLVQPQRHPAGRLIFEPHLLTLEPASQAVVRLPRYTWTQVGHTVLATQPQPICWDIAGLIVEWALTPQQTSALLAHYQQPGSSSLSASVLVFYCAAYAAFRLGMAHLCASAEPDPAEQARLWHAYDEYRTALAYWLDQPLNTTPTAPR